MPFYFLVSFVIAIELPKVDAPTVVPIQSESTDSELQQAVVYITEKMRFEVQQRLDFIAIMICCKSLFSDGENVSIGQPDLDNVAVKGHIVEQGKSKKIIVFKYKRRKRYRRKQGHRQPFTAIQIDAIEA